MNTNLINLIDQYSTSEKSHMIDYLQNPKTFYFGIDPTGNDIHLGHLIMLKTSIELIKHKWNAIILIGGFTGNIGDPTDKLIERKILESSKVQEFSIGILNDIQHIMRNYQVKYVNNKTWLHMDLAEYMNYARHISINKKIKLDIFARRLNEERSLSMLEFMYPDLQAIDFCYLNKNYNCTLQIGGRDQWGNISSGIQLIHKISQQEVHGFTTPLLTVKGNKMGKSTNNAVNLYDNIHKVIHFLTHLPQDTKDQLINIFCDVGTNNYIESILLLLLYEKNIVNTEMQAYSNRNTELANKWWYYTQETKFSNIISKIYNISKEKSKDLIDQKACYINNELVIENIRLNINTLYKFNIGNNMTEYIQIYEENISIESRSLHYKTLLELLHNEWHIPYHIGLKLLTNNKCYINDILTTTDVKLNKNDIVHIIEYGYIKV